jgi:hypothetical protein
MVSLDDNTKERFDRLQEDGTTQSEFVAILLDHYEYSDDDGAAQVSAIIDRLDELEKSVPVQCELGAYRGTTEAITNE